MEDHRPRHMLVIRVNASLHKNFNQACTKTLTNANAGETRIALIILRIVELKTQSHIYLISLWFIHSELFRYFYCDNLWLFTIPYTFINGDLAEEIKKNKTLHLSLCVQVPHLDSNRNHKGLKKQKYLLSLCINCNITSCLWRQIRSHELEVMRCKIAFFSRVHKNVTVCGKTGGSVG